jgi:hypothetical protein
MKNEKTAAGGNAKVVSGNRNWPDGDGEYAETRGAQTPFTTYNLPRKPATNF